MKTFTNGVKKFFLANLAVVGVIGMLPVFVITPEVPVFNNFIDYLFNNGEA